MLIRMGAELAASKFLSLLKSFGSRSSSGSGEQAGAAIGALLGSLIPGVGPVVGSAVGSFAGSQFGHQGGLVTPHGISRYHSGGLASNEFPAILQTGEVVLSNRAVNSIGRENALSLNRTGQVSGGDTFNVVINNYGGNAEGIAELVESNSFIDAFKNSVHVGTYSELF